jgi:H+/Cl- antiporter ClcA
MSEDLNFRSKEYWNRLVWGVLLGLLSAIGAFIFIFLMNWGQRIFLPSLTNWTLLSGPWWLVVLMTVAGFLVGVIHRLSSAKQMNVFDAVKTGDIDSKPVPSSLLVSLISLITGFSLGPEVPTGMLAGGLGKWISKRRNMNPEKTKMNIISGVSGAYAGLFSSPVVVLLMILETDHKQSIHIMVFF